jgi:SP family sugar:H+ symporter-like MFS transporter
VSFFFFPLFLSLLRIPSQPLGIRAKSMSLAVASNWLWNFGIGYATPYLVNPTTTGVNGVKAANLGVKVFFIWGSTCIGCLVFT